MGRLIKTSYIDHYKSGSNANTEQEKVRAMERKIRKSELPESLRVKLDERSENKLWRKIDEKGGIKAFAEKSGFSRSRLYNYKNKDLFLPLELVKSLISIQDAEIVAFKSGSSSHAVRNPDFPLQVSDELLTRVKASVNVNRDGTPVYTTKERSLVERFIELIDQIGGVPYKIYSRRRFELRYPIALQTLFGSIKFEKDRDALIDEKAEITAEGFRLEDKIVAFDEAGKLYSRDKKLRKALETEGKQEFEELIQEGVREAEKFY